VSSLSLSLSLPSIISLVDLFLEMFVVCRSCIHTFPVSSLLPSASSSSTSTSSSTAITAISQSPAIDVLGVGYSNGTCVLFDVRMGEPLGRVRLDGDGAGQISAISFRNGTLSVSLLTSYQCVLM